MPFSIRLVAFAALCWLGLTPLHAQTQAPAATLLDVSTTRMAGNRVALRFRLEGTVTAPEIFTINDPARIVLDFFDTGNALSESELNIGQGVADSLSVLQGPDRTRAALSLSSLVPYEVEVRGNEVILTVSAGSAAASTASSTPSSSTPRYSNPGAAAAGATTRVAAVDFRRGALGEGVISISLSDPTATVDVREEGSRIIADFPGAQLARGQQRRMDVTDFATPVLQVEAVNRDSGARISITPTGFYEYLAYQADDRYVIEVKPLLEDEVQRPGEKEYKGELLSLNFQDIEVRAILQIIADFTGLNVVVSDTVQGNLTLRLQNVPWDQALDIILQTKGLTQRRNGNVIYLSLIHI